MYKFTLEGLKPLKSEPYVYSEIQTKWLEALRSGKYKQGQGFLKDAAGGYCCMGVLCELAGLKSRLETSASRAHLFSDENITYWSSGFLPSPIVEKAGLRSALGEFANGVNFPNVLYGKVDLELLSGEEINENFPSHTSLASMNDVRMLDGLTKKRGFTFREIADYIEFDPWNVFRDAA